MKARQILNLFRYVAIIEGTTYILLGITMPLKYMADMPSPNFYVGLIHGIFFILYMGLLMYSWIQFSWPFVRVILLFLASIIPLGAFLADAKILKPLYQAVALSENN